MGLNINSSAGDNSFKLGQSAEDPAPSQNPPNVTGKGPQNPSIHGNTDEIQKAAPGETPDTKKMIGAPENKVPTNETKPTKGQQLQQQCNDLAKYLDDLPKPKFIMRDSSTHEVPTGMPKEFLNVFPKIGPCSKNAAPIAKLMFENGTKADALPSKYKNSPELMLAIGWELSRIGNQKAGTHALNDALDVYQHVLNVNQTPPLMTHKGDGVSTVHKNMRCANYRTGVANMQKAMLLFMQAEERNVSKPEKAKLIDAAKNSTKKAIQYFTKAQDPTRPDPFMTALISAAEIFSHANDIMTGGDFLNGAFNYYDDLNADTAIAFSKTLS